MENPKLSLEFKKKGSHLKQCKNDRSIIFCEKTYHAFERIWSLTKVDVSGVGIFRYERH